MLNSLNFTRNLVLSTVTSDVRNCTKCNLCKSSGLSVFGEGNSEADIMFIGEGPGEQEERTGRPFVGKAGKLLDNMISSIDLKREEVYITNIVKHRPPNNRNPLPEEIKACLPFLHMQIATINPHIIVVLGSVAMNALLEPGQGITKRCGKWEKYYYEDKYGKQDILTMPVFHPAALLRNPQWKKPAWYAMQEVKTTHNNFLKFVERRKDSDNQDKKASIRISQS